MYDPALRASKEANDSFTRPSGEEDVLVPEGLAGRDPPQKVPPPSLPHNHFRHASLGVVHGSPHSAPPPPLPDPPHPFRPQVGRVRPKSKGRGELDGTDGTGALSVVQQEPTPYTLNPEHSGCARRWLFGNNIPMSLQQDVEWGGWVEESMEVGLLGEEGEGPQSELNVCSCPALLTKELVIQDSRVLVRNLISRESDSKAVTRLHMLSTPKPCTRWSGNAGNEEGAGEGRGGGPNPLDHRDD